MIDTASPLIVGGILILGVLVIAFVVYLIAKKFLPGKLVAGIVLVFLGYHFKPLYPWNYLFYIAGVIFLILFVVDLIKKKKVKK